MRQFFAILGDSFREAVDGFVIYAMLGLSAFVILIVGSMSFTPAAPEEAFEKIVSDHQFRVVYPDKGRSRAINRAWGIEYHASDVRPADGGSALRLTVKGQSQIFVNGKPDLSKGDSFRSTVASWARLPSNTAKQSDLVGKGGKGGGGPQGKQDVPALEVSLDQEPTPEEQLAVTDAMMEEFVKSQFEMHAGMEVAAARVKAGAEEPTYAFDVTTHGGSAVRGWPHTVKIFFGAVTVSRDAHLGMVLWIIEDRIINGLGAVVAILIGLILTAFFIPNMLRKGSVDLLISKPIGRPALLIYKYIGGLTFIFLVSAFTIGGVWVVLAARSGYWNPDFLVIIPVLTFSFAILYAASTLAAVLSRSPIVAMLVAAGFAVFLYVVGKAKEIVDLMRAEGEGVPKWVTTLVDTLNTLLPRYKDLDKLTSKLIGSGTLTEGESRMFGIAQLDYPSWTATFGVSFVFIALMLAISCWWFSKRDY